MKFFLIRLITDRSLQRDLLYDGNNNIVTESQMRAFASRADWKLIHPRYDDHLGVCTCPGELKRVWLAPRDLISLFGDSVPGAFARLWSRRMSGPYPKDEHVKTCISGHNLTRL